MAIHDDKFAALDRQGHSHGREIAELQVTTREHTKDIAALWKHKVGIDRYVWVERIVWGAMGAAGYWALLHMPATSAAAQMLVK